MIMYTCPKPWKQFIQIYIIADNYIQIARETELITAKSYNFFYPINLVTGAAYIRVFIFY